MRNIKCIRIFSATSLLLLLSMYSYAQPLPAWKRPGPCNTGPTNESILVPSETINARTDGEVIENVFVKGMINIYANNVTIRNFKIDADSTWYGIRIYNNAKGLLIEDGEIFNYLSASVGTAANFTARRMNIHESEGDGFKAGDNSIIESCYIHHIGKKIDAHADGIQIAGGSNIKITGNYISSLGDGTGNPAPSPYQFHAAIIMQCNFAPVDSVWVENNWLDNGSYTINGAVKDFGSPTNVFIHNNHFGGFPQYGYIRSEEWFKDTVDNLFDPMGTRTMPECDWSFPVPVSGIILSPSKMILIVGESREMTATIVPADAGNQAILWSVAPDSVVAVDSSGMVRALKSGRAKILATTLEGNFVDSCSVEVQNITSAQIVYLHDNLLSVYPNPTSGALHISFSESLKEDSVLDLIDLSGKVVQSSMLEKGGQDYILGLENQIYPGVYLLRISNNKCVILNKIVVK